MIIARYICNWRVPRPSSLRRSSGGGQHGVLAQQLGSLELQLQVATCTIFDVKVLAGNLDQTCRVAGGVIGVGRSSQNDMACSPAWKQRRNQRRLAILLLLGQGRHVPQIPIAQCMLMSPLHTQVPQSADPSAETTTHSSLQPLSHSSQVCVTGSAQRRHSQGVHWDHMEFAARVGV